MEIKLFLYERSQILIYPSCAPEIILLSERVHFYNTEIPSEWPSKVPIKGLANNLFNLTALNALWYYRALENECSAKGVRITELCGSCVRVWILTMVYYLIGMLKKDLKMYFNYLL
jgi:hypothetical protein